MAFAWEALQARDTPVVFGSLGVSGYALRCKLGTLDVVAEGCTENITDALTHTTMVALDGIKEGFGKADGDADGGVTKDFAHSDIPLDV